MPATQTYKNHARFDPAMHYFVFPVLLLNIVAAAYVTIRAGLHYGFHLHLWLLIVSIALLILAGKARASALKVQDRVIRLEERTRLAALVTQSELIELQSLTTPQLIALRFASDPELPMLARHAVREKLTPKQIKQAIVSWRADYERV